MVDPCLTTTLLPSVLSEMTATVGGSPTTQTVAIQDQASLDYGDQASPDYGDGFSFCPERTYTIASTPNTASTSLPAALLTVDTDGLITLGPVDLADYVGTHEATLTIGGPSADEITITFSIAISCDLTSLTLNSALVDQTYIIGDPVMILSFDQTFATQTPLCQRTLQFAFTNLPLFVTQSVDASTGATTLEAFSTNNADDGQSSLVTVTGWTLGDITITAVDTFTFNAVSPCHTAVIDPLQLE